jgi:hypothetical protein
MEERIARMNLLEGNKIKDVIVSEDKTEVLFIMYNAGIVKMYHDQDCCESVWLEDVSGDWDDIKNTEIIEFRKTKSTDKQFYKTDEILDDSVTWTFYTFRTIKGDVTLRWCGTSNGYYSEEVLLEPVNIQREYLDVLKKNKTLKRKLSETIPQDGLEKIKAENSNLRSKVYKANLALEEERLKVDILYSLSDKFYNRYMELKGLKGKEDQAKVVKTCRLDDRDWETIKNIYF